MGFKSQSTKRSLPNTLNVLMNTYSKKHIVFFHLLNDFSGSPKVLRQAIESLKSNNTLELYTCSSNKKGFLSDIENLKYNYFFYKWSKIKLVTLVLFFWSQLLLFFRLLRFTNTNKKQTIFYVNTVLPIGAALAGKLLGIEVIYHIHETSIKPKAFKWLLFKIANICSKKSIYVSNFIQKQEPLKNGVNKVIYNTLSNDFFKTALETKTEKSTVLMLSSLKEYKGVFEFITLATSNPQISFELVSNATQIEVDNYLLDTNKPSNLKIFSTQSNVHPFYKRAKVVLNLSHPDKWVETFGMTALEAMSYKTPVIVPPVGGIAEVVQHNINGFHISVQNLKEISDKINLLFNKPKHYQTMSENAFLRTKAFTTQVFEQEIQSFVAKS